MNATVKLTSLSDYLIPGHAVRLLKTDIQYFVSHTDGKEAKMIEVLGLEHGLLIWKWCVMSLQEAEA